MLVDEMLPLKAKDPYEFNDEFDEDSPSSSFRARLDVSFFFHHARSELMT